MSYRIHIIKNTTQWLLYIENNNNFVLIDSQETKCLWQI